MLRAYACPLICMPPGTGLRGVLDQACAAEGIRPVMAVEASAGEAIAQLAQRGLGVGILSESMTAAGQDGLTAMVIDDIAGPGRARGDLEPGASPALRELITRCRAAFGADRRADHKRAQCALGLNAQHSLT